MSDTNVVEIETPTYEVELVGEELELVETVVVEEIELALPGPPGQDGTDGVDGVDGAPGASGGFYRHIQGAAADTWDIVHGLGYRPGGVDAFDTDMPPRRLEADIEHIDGDHLVLRFYTAGVLTAVAGEAYLS